jgi:hypothetical protein
MAFNYGKIATLADSLLAEYGQKVTITRRSDGEYNPTTGEVMMASETYQTGKGLLMDYGQSMIDGSMIQAGDKQLFLSVVGLSSVKIGDLVTTADSITRTITSIKDYNPAGVSVMMECNLRA